MYGYVYQYFGMLIVLTVTCISCHQKKRPKVLKDNSFILSLEVITSKNKNLHPFVMIK